MALFTTTLDLYGGVLWSGELQGFIIHQMMPTLGEAGMGPGHRQNGGQRQEPHLDATEGHFVGRGVPSWLLLVWGVFGKSVGAWWGLSRASKGLRAASFCV